MDESAKLKHKLEVDLTVIWLVLTVKNLQNSHLRSDFLYY